MFAAMEDYETGVWDDLECRFAAAAAIAIARTRLAHLPTWLNLPYRTVLGVVSGLLVDIRMASACSSLAPPPDFANTQQLLKQRSKRK